MNRIKNTIAQFIPILAIFIILSQYQLCVEFSHTILGKIVIASLVLFYTSIDKVLGLFVCALVILFYQMDCVENMLNIEPFDTIEKEEIEEEFDPEYVKIKPAKSCGCAGAVKDIETFENYEHDEEQVIQDVKVQDEFRREHCKKGMLTHKDMNVKNEMAQHVYPELQFKKEYCNACSPTCQFSIIESKLKTEIKLLPQSSK
jgi:hypothetical protein